MSFNLIIGWSSKNLECHFCGTNRSVKYEANINGKKICVCNKCVLIENDLIEDLMMEQREQM